jgi:futalosine hydrolase
MRIALVAATRQEITPLTEYLTERVYLKNHHRFSIIITGVGIINAVYVLTKRFMAEKPDLAIQAGIAGGLHPIYSPGNVLAVKDEMIADMGVTENDQWMDVFDLQLVDGARFPFNNRKLINPHKTLLAKTHLQAVCGITVNEITTHPEKILQIIEKYSAVTESMEGAAFHYVCLQEGIPFVQMRAISNFIGERNKDNWKMQEAIQNLNNEVIGLINRLTNHL